MFKSDCLILIKFKAKTAVTENPDKHRNVHFKEQHEKLCGKFLRYIKKFKAYNLHLTSILYDE